MGKTAIVVNGTETKNVFPAITLGASAAATGDEVILFFTPSGAPAMLKGAFEKLNETAKNLPDLMEMVEALRSLNARFMVCELAFDVHGFGAKDLREGAEVVGATTFVGAAQGAGLTLSF
jgi:predicted peroxiredoxin